MTVLLLDTHAWIWYAAGNPRIKRHVRTIERARNEGSLLLSSISIYEAANLGIETDLGRRTGARAIVMRPTVQSWIRQALTETGVLVADIEADHGIDAALLTAMHPDPFDRLIVASALRANAKLATADEKIMTFAKRARLPVLAL